MPGGLESTGPNSFLLPVLIDCSTNCKRCVTNVTNTCTECNTGAKLFSNVCKKVTAYFLKTPMTNYPNRYLSINTNTNNFSLEKENKVTITVWIKFFGQIQSSTSDCVVLFRLKSDGSMNICYRPSDLNLYYYDKTLVMYKDKSFNSLIGQWILISISSFNNNVASIPDLNNYFPYLFRFYVHNQEIQKNPDYSFTPPGITFNSFDIGNEFSGLVSDLRFYRDFIVNPYGYVFGNLMNNVITYYVPLMNVLNTVPCVSDSNLNLDNFKDVSVLTSSTYASTLGINCQADYTPYVDTKCDSKSWFDIQVATRELPCEACSGTCLNSCAYSTLLSDNSNIGCTCNFNTADQWLKVDKSSQKLFCEAVPQYDFSRGNTTVNNIKVATNGEYTMEFWFYINSYNNSTILFDSYEVIWDLHNYIKIYNGNSTTFGTPTTNQLFAHCSPIYNSNNRTSYIGDESIQYSGNSDFGYDDQYYSSNTSSLNFTKGGFYRWTYVQCSTSVPRNSFYLNSQLEYKIKYDDSLKINTTNYNTSSLIFQSGSKTRANFGFIFIREVKLWSQYDVRRFTTKCKFTSDILSYFKQTLMHYFTNNLPGTSIKDTLNPGVTGQLNKRSDFIGYNLMDKVNATDLNFDLTDDCSTLNISPITGVNNRTTFVIQSKEIQQSVKNSYRFYYKVKDFTDIIDVGSTTVTKEVNYMFNVDQKYFNSATSNNTVVLEIYCDIIYLDQNNFSTPKTITLYKILTLYKEVSFTNNFSYTNILSNLDLTSTISNDQLKLRTDVIKDMQTDLPTVTVQNSTIVVANNTNNSDVVQIVQPSCETTVNYCNNRGYCYKSNMNLYCLCYSIFEGQTCQISKINSASLKNYTSKLYDIINSRLGNSSNVEQNLDANTIKSTKNLISVYTNFYQNVSDLSPIMNVVGNLMTTAANSTVGSKLSASFDDVGDIMTNLLDFYFKGVDSQKYDNLKDYVQNNNTQNLSGFNDIKYDVKYVNLNPVSTQKMRLLQQDVSSFILNITGNMNKLELTDSQKKLYSDYLSRLNGIIYNMTLSIINGNRNKDIDILYSSNIYDLIIKKVNDVNSFSFLNYFKDRAAKKKSYFDASKCIKQMLQGSNSTSVYFMYVNYKINERPYDNLFVNSTISSGHHIVFIDNNLKEINVSCLIGNEIVHYLPLIDLNNKDFFKDFYTNASKYSDENLPVSTDLYHPSFIFPNGTIDHSDLSVQIQNYFTQFTIDLRSFNKDNNTYVSNGTQFRSVKSGYVISTSNHLSEFNLFADQAPVRNFKPNYYFINFPQIYSCSENYINNMCFYIIIIMFGVYILILSILLIGACVTKNYSKENFSNRIAEELNQLQKDNLKFGDNRYSFYYDFNEELKELNKNDYIESISDSPARFNILPLEKEGDKDDNNKFNDVEIVPNKIQVKSVEEGSVRNTNEENNESLNKNNVIDQKLQLKDQEAENLKDNTDKEKTSKFESISNNNADDHLVSIPNDKKTLHSYNIYANDNIKYYNFFYFILLRNIYSNFCCVKSSFTPKYKSFSRVALLFYSLFVVICICLTFLEINLFNYKEVDSGRLVGFLFISISFSNLLLILVSLIINPGIESRMKFLKKLQNISLSRKKGKSSKLYNLVVKNSLHTAWVNILILALFALLFYLSVGFCAVWVNWAPNVLILWAFALLLDFLLMEVLLELLILLFFSLRSILFFGKIFKFFLAIKTLRNFD